MSFGEISVKDREPELFLENVGFMGAAFVSLLGFLVTRVGVGWRRDPWSHRRGWQVGVRDQG